MNEILKIKGTAVLKMSGTYILGSVKKISPPPSPIQNGHTHLEPEDAVRDYSVSCSFIFK